MSTLERLPERLKEWRQKHSEAIIRFVEFTLVAVIFFGLGAFWVEQVVYGKPPLAVVEPKDGYAPARPSGHSGGLVAPIILDSETSSKIEEPKKALAQNGEYVASRNGKTYYRADCTHRIKEENMIFFKTKEDAEKVGLTPAKSCF